MRCSHLFSRAIHFLQHSSRTVKNVYNQFTDVSNNYHSPLSSHQQFLHYITFVMHAFFSLVFWDWHFHHECDYKAIKVIAFMDSQQREYIEHVHHNVLY